MRPVQRSSVVVTQDPLSVQLVSELERTDETVVLLRREDLTVNIPGPKEAGVYVLGGVDKLEGVTRQRIGGYTRLSVRQPRCMRVYCDLATARRDCLTLEELFCSSEADVEARACMLEAEAAALRERLLGEGLLDEGEGAAE